MDRKESESLADDILRGCPAIAGFIGETERRTFTLLQTGAIPGRKELGLWVASKSKLRAHYSESNNTPGERQR
jgi:hypothetical protein